MMYLTSFIKKMLKHLGYEADILVCNLKLFTSNLMKSALVISL